MVSPQSQLITNPKRPADCRSAGRLWGFRLRDRDLNPDRLIQRNRPGKQRKCPKTPKFQPADLRYFPRVNCSILTAYGFSIQSLTTVSNRFEGRQTHPEAQFRFTDSEGSAGESTKAPQNTDSNQLTYGVFAESTVQYFLQL